MTSAVPSVYAQLLSVGVVFVWVHCIGMCGPITVGLDVGGQRSRVGPGGAVLRVLAYQAGRTIPYAFAGMLFGLVGAGLKGAFQLGGGLISVALGGVALAVAFGVGPRSTTTTTTGLLSIGPPRAPSLLDRALAAVRLRLLPLTAGPDVTSRILLGAVLGLLPCMITFWALGLAAVSGSPLHGALVMLLLVALTTPVLLVANLAPRLLPRPGPRLARVLPRLLLGVSGTVVVLAGLAGMGLISHAHVGFRAFGETWMLMFW